MPTIWIKKEYLQGFGFEYISLKKTVHMFQLMDIDE